MEIDPKVYGKADELLYHISLSADSLMYIGYGLMQQNGNDCEEGNAVQYIAHCLHDQIHELREMVFGDQRNDK